MKAAWAMLFVLLGSACDRPHVIGATGSSDEGSGDSVNRPGGGGSDGGVIPMANVVVTAVPVQARHLVFDPKGKRLFASVGSGLRPNANTIVIIDPASMRAVGQVEVGSDPGSLAISDDGTKLWVGLDGSAAVQEVDLTMDPPAAGRGFSLPAGGLGPIWVLQDSPSAVAVRLRDPLSVPDLAGVAIFDDGFERATRAPGHTGAARLVRGERGWLFGFNNLHTGFGFYSMPVTESGVTQLEFPGLLSGFDTDIVYGGGRVYATTGGVVDVTNPMAPRLVGTFPVKGLIAPVPAKKRAFMLTPGLGVSLTFGFAQLRVLDTERFTVISSTELRTVGEDKATDLVQTSDRQLAYVAGQNLGNEVSRIVFLQVDPLP